MNRAVTYVLRTIMDEWLPAGVRDSRWFMYPFFRYWFRNHDLARVMDFKALQARMTDAELAAFYRDIQTVSRERRTDLNEASIRHILASLDPASSTLLDVGCGNGYFLGRAHEAGYRVHGCDLLRTIDVRGIPYTTASAERLPFRDRAFDVVTCHHTLEHVRGLADAVAELKRVARRQIVVTVPCQRPYYYTLDLHIHFFPVRALLETAMAMPRATCRKIGGDWVYVAPVGDGV